MKNLSCYFIVLYLTTNTILADTIILNADGQGNPFNHIKRQWGDSATQTIPDCIENKNAHIKEVFDSTLNKFVFDFISFASDIECPTSTTTTNQIHTVIKVDGSAPANLKTTLEGTSSNWRWLFKLEHLSLPDNSITDIFQAKGEPDNHPRLSLSFIKNNGKNNFQFNYANDAGELQTLVEIEEQQIQQIQDQWLEVRCQIFWSSNHGELSFSIHNYKTGQELVNYHSDSIDLWGENWDYMRPIFGIYRESKNNQQLTGVSLLFSDISITSFKYGSVFKQNSNLHLPDVVFQDKHLWANLEYLPNSNPSTWKLTETGINGFKIQQPPDDLAVVEVKENFDIYIPAIYAKGETTAPNPNNPVYWAILQRQTEDSIFWQIKDFQQISRSHFIPFEDGRLR